MNREDILNNAAIYDFWATADTILNKKETTKTSTDWPAQINALSAYNISIDEALQQVYANALDYNAFTEWIAEADKPNVEDSDIEDILTTTDLAFWQEHGYVVVKNIISKEQCAATRNAIWEYLCASPDEPKSWYQPHSGKKGMMLRFFKHPTLNANRNSKKIRKVYEQLYKGEEMFLFIDKVSFNPPLTKGHKFAGSELHWDVSLELPIPLGLQGLVYLNDVAAEDGAFHCVPGFHKRIDKWINSLPEGVNPRHAALEQLQPIPITGNAGDLIVWHQALPHCATPNTGTMPRLVQYIAYNRVNMQKREWK